MTVKIDVRLMRGLRVVDVRLSGRYGDNEETSTNT